MKTNQELYSSLPRRIKASLIDSLIVLTLFIALPVTFNALFQNESVLAAFLMYTPILILEPLLVSFSGATIGQHLFGVEVVKINTLAKCPLLLSFIRYYTKILLGGFSVIYMLFSKKHQAIHDYIAGTIVIMSRKRIKAEPDFASQGEQEQYENSGYNYPSAPRRFFVFILWFIIAIVILSIILELASLAFVPNYTLETETYPEVIEIVSNIVAACLFFTLAFLGAKGFLFGARRVKISEE